MDTGLKGKTVLITGASRNIGALAAISFAREGTNLASEDAGYVTGQAYLMNGGLYFH